MALRIDSSQNRNLYVGTSTGVAVNDGNAIITGKVGIGVTNPGTKLDVAGNATVGSGLGAVDTDGVLTINGGSGGGGEAYLNLTRGGTSGFILNHAISNIQVRGTTNIPMHFWTNNLIRQTIAANGNVGIGTESPDTKLMVSGEILSENTNGGYFISTRVPSSSSRPTLNFYGTALDINHVTGYAGGGASTKMTILSGGNVGIGVTNPEKKLHVKTTTSNSTPQVLVQNGGTGDASMLLNVSGQSYVFGIDYDDSKKFKIASSSNLGTTDRVTLLSTGQVGIGTITPSEKLQVAGNIKIQSALLSNQENTDIDSAAAETVAQVAIATYTAAFFDFVVKKSTNVRSGTVYACHDGTNVEFTETSTQDLGDTSDVVLSVDISGGQMRLRATVASDNWSVKSLIRAI